jgi:branched-chain amino acid transport system substrate-binding protein
MNERRRLVLTLCSALAVPAGSLVAACRSPETLRIGFVGGLSGRVADLGVAGRNGAQLAIENLNTSGAEHCELLIEDDRQDAAQVRAAVTVLAERGVSFIVGPMTSAMAVAVLPEVNRRRLVMISPTANTHELSGLNDYLFRVIADAPAGARQLAELLHRRGIATLGVLMDKKNRAYSESFGHACGQRLRELGGKVSTELAFESGSSVDLAGLSTQLLSGRPDLVLLVASAVDVSLVAQPLRRNAPAIGLAASPWAATEQLMQLGGRAVEGMIVPQAVDRESQAPAYVEFRLRYRERFGDEPGSGAVNAFDAVMMGVQALRRRSGSQTLRDVLAVPGVAWRGLQRAIVLDAGGDDASPIFMTEVRAGRFVSIRP